MNIKLNCRLCGDTHFCFPSNGTDSSVVKCSGCRRDLGTLGEIKEQVARTISRQLTAS